MKLARGGQKEHFLPAQDLDFIFKRVLLALKSFFVYDLHGEHLTRSILGLCQADLGEGTTGKEKRIYNFIIQAKLYFFLLFCL